MSHFIKFNDAVTLVSNFVNNAVLGQIATDKALGGTIDKNSFQNQVPVQGFESGKMAWFCWDENNEPAHHPFFLAFEQFDKFTDNPFPDEPEHDNLQIAAEQFTYSQGQDVAKMLQTQSQSLANPINKDISKSDAIPFINYFGTSFPASSSNTPFNQESFCFINSEIPQGEEKSEWEEFVTQPDLVAIRYYFGLDESSTVNKIRIIYIGVDANGRNMISNDVNSALIINKGTP